MFIDAHRGTLDPKFYARESGRKPSASSGKKGRILHDKVDAARGGGSALQLAF